MTSPIAMRIPQNGAQVILLHDGAQKALNTYLDRSSTRLLTAVGDSVRRMIDRSLDEQPAARQWTENAITELVQTFGPPRTAEEVEYAISEVQCVLADLTYAGSRMTQDTYDSANVVECEQAINEKADALIADLIGLTR